MKRKKRGLLRNELIMEYSIKVTGSDSLFMITFTKSRMNFD